MKRKIIYALSILIGVLTIGGISAFSYFDSKYNYKEIDKEDLGINEDFSQNLITYEDNKEEEKQEIDISGIKSIALFGLDRRTSDEKGSRSDSIMVATVNFDTKELKITSFMRDMLVDIEGHGKDKLNHAYSYGGPELAIKTLNQNFGLNIQDYVSVDFLMLEGIIDDIGGVSIDVQEEEVGLINQYMEEVAVKNNKQFDKLSSSGLVELDGGQAVAYSRIRAHGNGDYERTERQRTVLSAIVNKLSEVDVLSLPAVASTVLANTETSIKSTEAIGLGKDYLSTEFGEIQTERIPRDGSFTAGIQNNGLWAMVVDFDKEREYLKEWIFEVPATEDAPIEDTYVPSESETVNFNGPVKMGM